MSYLAAVDQVSENQSIAPDFASDTLCAIASLLPNLLSLLQGFAEAVDHITHYVVHQSQPRDLAMVMMPGLDTASRRKARRHHRGTYLEFPSTIRLN